MPANLTGEVNTIMGKIRKLTRDSAKSLVATGLQRAASTYGMAQVEAEATCGDTCLRNALSQSTLMEMHFVLNVLPLDGTVMDEALAAVGFCLVPLEMDFDTDMEVIAELSGLLNEWLIAMKDGKRDHIETQKIAARIRYLLPKLRGVVGEADRLRVAA
jgi:hypothetical protein